MSQWRGTGKKRRGRAGPSEHGRQNPAVRDASGRLHLVLHQDPSSGAARLTLRSPLFEQDWQNAVAESAASTCYAALREGVELKRTVALTQHLMDATSELAEGLIARAANGSVACKPGCDHCCYQSVGVTAAEALTIHAHVQSTLSSAALAALTEHVTTAHQRTRQLSSQERFSPDHPCPFLKAAQCTIYEVRPLSCRGMNSLDAVECKDNLRDPEARAAFLASGVGGSVFLEPIRAFHAISAGLQLSLSELYQLDMRPLDLTAAMHALLTDGGAIAAEWLQGNAAFAAARGGDSTENARILELSGRVASPLSNRAGK